MRAFDFWRVDVFTTRPLEGNPLAVFPRAEGLSDAEMLAIAREMNISETTFVLPPTDPSANYRNRIFSVGGEMPFAGHPSIGTAYVAAMEKLVPVGEGVTTIRQEVKIGVLPIDLEVKDGQVRRVVMTQGKPAVARRLTKIEALARALGVRSGDIAASGLWPQVASTGIPSLQVPLASLDAVRRLDPDMAALGKVLAKIDKHLGAYVFSFETEGEADLHARGFFPLHGIKEDPATGSAAGACGAYLAANKRLPPREWFVIEQGIEAHHPSRIEVNVEVSIEDTKGRARTVRVGGEVTPVMRGTLHLS